MRVRVRRLRDGEEHLVQQVFDQMSPQARFLRFHAPVPRLPAGARRALARREEGKREPVVAMLGDRAVRLGQWVRDPHDRSRAELSVAVTDDVRGRGVGRRVTRALAVSAAAHGVRRFDCHVHSENRPLRDRLQAEGGRIDGTDPVALVVPVVAFLPFPHRIGRPSGGSAPTRPVGGVRDVGGAWFDGGRGVRRPRGVASRA